MTYTLTQPQVVAAAAAEVAGIGSGINAADTAAARATTGIVAAAADEVSTAAATLFNTYAQQCRVLINRAAVFHDEFVQSLAAAAGAYAEAEAAAASALGAFTARVEPLLAPLTGSAANGMAGASATVKAAVADPDAALIMTGTDQPTPPTAWIPAIYQNYIAPNFPVPSGNVQGLSTAEGLYPLTAVKDLTLNISVARGAAALNSAILQQLATPGINSVVVSGYSQSSMVASVVMPQLLAEHVPTSAVDFVLLGNPMNPNGGVAARFPGLTAPSLGVIPYGATPANDYPTVTYTLEYDGFADFPRYPIDILSDLNAIFGIPFVHGWYPLINPGALPPGYSITTLPTQGPTMSTYYMITVPNLPLLDPLRLIPYIGNPIADLLQGPLTPLVNWGYGDPAYGYSTSPANVPTPFGFLPPPGATLSLVPALISSTQQGIIRAYNDIHAWELPAPPAISPSAIAQALASYPVPTLVLPTSPASAITDVLLGVEAANTQISGAVANGFSAAYATQLPTADIATAVAFSLPSYDVNLFLNGIIQAVNGQPVVGLSNAIADPIIADVLGLTLAAGTEVAVLGDAGYLIVTASQFPFVAPPFFGALPPWLPQP